MELTVHDQYNNPMPGFGMDDIAVRNGAEITLSAMQDLPYWSVSFNDHGNGTYTVDLDSAGNEDTVWDVIVDNVDIQEDMPVEITGN